MGRRRGPARRRPRAGDDDLAGLRGIGQFSAPQSGEATITLDYEFGGVMARWRPAAGPGRERPGRAVARGDRRDVGCRGRGRPAVRLGRHGAVSAPSLPGRPSMDRLRQVLGLPPVRDGAARRPARGRRLRHAAAGPRRPLGLAAPHGVRPARGEAVSAARAEVLQDALAGLAPAEQETFDALLSRVVVAMIRGPGATRWMCSLCDTGTCHSAPGGYPVANAARERVRVGMTIGSSARAHARRCR